MEYEDEDLKILELINRGVKTFRDIKNILKIKNEELEKTLGILDQSQMITTTTKTGLLGQKKIVLELTEDGTKKIDEYVKMLLLNGTK